MSQSANDSAFSVELDAALKEIARPFSDRRLNVFEVQVDSYEQNRLALRGKVLEESNRKALEAGLAERSPDLQVNTEGVEVLRKASPKLMTVATNLTSVHDGTSFLAEQITQMVNGTQVEVLMEEQRWCFVRQADGYLGWTYQPYLTGDAAPQPSHLVMAPVSLLRRMPSSSDLIVTRVLGGTAVHVTAEREGWLGVALAGGSEGFLPREDLCAFDAFDRKPQSQRETLVALAHQLIGVPYLWGGCTAHGIDCSGFAQLLHRWVGITLPRDADMQCEAGSTVDYPFKPGDLLFFGEQGERRRITHVAVSLGGWDIIHSSRSRNGVHLDNVQEVLHLRESYLCAAAFIGK